MHVLWLPIVLSTIALFFCSFLSWMVFQLHQKDWQKMEEEEAFLRSVSDLNIPEGNYMFPGTSSAKEMQDESYIAKYKAGPRGIVSFLPEANMGKNLGLTVLYFFVCCCTFAYLANFALMERGDVDFLTVFRFVATIALLTFGASIIQHAIWFKARVVGHVIESIAYSLIAGNLCRAVAIDDFVLPPRDRTA